MAEMEVGDGCENSVKLMTMTLVVMAEAVGVTVEMETILK